MASNLPPTEEERQSMDKAAESAGSEDVLSTVTTCSATWKLLVRLDAQGDAYPDDDIDVTVTGVDGALTVDTPSFAVKMTTPVHELTVTGTGNGKVRVAAAMVSSDWMPFAAVEVDVGTIEPVVLSTARAVSGSFRHTTVGLEYECSIKLKTDAARTVAFTSAAVSSPASMWKLVSVTRDISAVSGSTATGTLEFVTGPIEAIDSQRFHMLYAFLSGFFKQWRTGERDAATLAAAMEQDGHGVAGSDALETKQEEQKQEESDDEEDWDTGGASNNNEDNALSREEMMALFRNAGKFKPRFEGESTESCSSTPQVNLGVQLAALGQHGSEAAKLLAKELSAGTRYGQVLAAVDGYLQNAQLPNEPTLKGIIVLYAMITNIYAEAAQAKKFDANVPIEDLLTGQLVDVSSVDYKNSWGALPKVKPAELWKQSANLRDLFWNGVLKQKIQAATAAFVKTFCDPGQRAAAETVFAALAVGTISPQGQYGSFSAAPKPIDPFLIRGLPAIVIELRGSSKNTNPLMISGGALVDPAAAAKALDAFAAIAI